jgi:hypothetical protein
MMPRVVGQVSVAKFPSLLAFTLVLAFVLSSALPAHADDGAPARARLSWTRTPEATSCIDAEALRLAVERRWGRRVFVDDESPDIVVKGAVRRDPRGAWSVKLELERNDGTSLGSRRIVTRAPDCSSLDDSLALALGLMLDLTEPSKSAENPGVEGPAQPIRPPVSGPPITIPKETVAPRVPWRFEPNVGVEGALGLFPGATLGGRLALGIEPPRGWRIELGGTLWGDRDATSGNTGAHFSMWTLDFGVCPLLTELDQFSAWACIAQRAGKIRAEGVGFDSNAAQDETLLSGEARIGGAWSFFRPFVMHAALGFDVPVVRFRFVYRDEHGAIAAVYRMAPVAGTLGLGIGARF